MTGRRKKGFWERLNASLSPQPQRNAADAKNASTLVQEELRTPEGWNQRGMHLIATADGWQSFEIAASEVWCIIANEQGNGDVMQPYLPTLLNNLVAKGEEIAAAHPEQGEYVGSCLDKVERILCETGLAERMRQREVREGSAILDDVEHFLGRFVAYPTDHARVAHALWISHCWFMQHWESTPRLAFLSTQPGSGKSRCLEVTEPLVPNAIHAVNVTPTYIFRKISDDAGLPTILFDEIDTVFNSKGGGNETLRGVLNAGYRRGATAGRCSASGIEELPAYCAVALAGLGHLPDTILTRSVVINLQRRPANVVVEPWRPRHVTPQAEALHQNLQDWAEVRRSDLAWPDLPEGVADRNADVWEPLLAVADLAGGAWPDKACDAALYLINHRGPWGA